MAMDKMKTRIIIILLVVIVFGGAYFGVLVTEQKKRFFAHAAMQDDLLASIADSKRRQAEYFAAVGAKKEELAKSMDAAKSQYEKLLRDQPALIEANKKGVSVPVEKTVTVQVPTTTPVVSKPISTRKTKTS
jgi:peptidoglycan hydrolase CwlO-like protein